MLEDLRERWRARLIDTPIRKEMEFTAQGLALGANTLLAKRGGGDPCWHEKDDDGRLSALLSAAYGRRVSTSALKHIRRAVLRQHEGDAPLAAMHLALASLGKLREPQDGARRLFMTEAFLDAGVGPDDVFAALGLGESDPLLTKYSPSQPRVPKGSGRPSGQWAREAFAMVGRAATAVERELIVTTRTVASAAGLSPAEVAAERQATSVMGRLSVTEGEWFAALAPEAAGPVVVLGVLLIPTNRSLDREGPIPGQPGWRYHWNGAETALYFGQDGTRAGPREIRAFPGKDGKFRDTQGHAVGAILPDGRVAIQLSALADALVDKNEPNICPVPTKDRPGSRENNKDYEDFVKRFVNPDNPTPRGLGAGLINPKTGKIVMFDDCQRSTGIMIEAKGAIYAHLLNMQKIIPNWETAGDLITQAKNQVAASQGRPIIWFFGSEEAANEARELAKRHKEAFGQIQIYALPWSGDR